MRKVALFAVVCTLFSTTCCVKPELNENQPGKVNELRVSAKDFVFDRVMTKTSFSVDEQEGLIFKWSDNDVLGIYPIGGDQVAFPISEGGNSKSAVFDGGSWALRPSKMYACYYPFSKENYLISEKKLPVSFTGQSQNGNNSTAGLGAYDYMAAPATAPDENGYLNITMEHLASIVRFVLKLPSMPGSMSAFAIRCNDKCITAAGTFDLSQEVPQIVSTAKVNYASMSLDNVNVNAQDSTVTLFMMMSPDNLAGKKIDVNLICSSGSVFAGSFNGKDMTAGMAYSYAINLVEQHNDTFVDLGLSVKWAVLNGGASAALPEGTIFNYYGAAIYAESESGRLPTKNEINELMNKDNCLWTWMESYDDKPVSGFLVKSKVNGNSIFLPASGGNQNGVSITPGLYGNYWTSDLTTKGTSAYFLYFTPSKYEWRSANCNYQYSVRLVEDQTEF